MVFLKFKAVTDSVVFLKLDELADIISKAGDTNEYRIRCKDGAFYNVTKETHDKLIEALVKLTNTIDVTNDEASSFELGVKRK